MPAEKIMHEFKHGTLRSGSGAKVTNPAQARAIAASYSKPQHQNVPPEVPTVDRETGAVSDTAEYQNLSQPMEDGWQPDEESFGDLHLALNFNDEADPKQRAKAAEEFHRGQKI